MIEVPLASVPNQTLSITLDQNVYDIAIYATGGSTVDPLYQGVMAVDIVRNGIPIISGGRAIFGYPVIPYQYLEDGNFVFDTMNDDYPDYREFGNTQSLLYFSQSELASLRAGT